VSAPSEPKVVLGSWGNVPSGIGSEARWLFKLLPLKTWIQYFHPQLGYGADVPRPGGKSIARGHRHRVYINHDILVSIERPIPRETLPEAKRFKLRTVVLSNPEWTIPGHNWHPLVDLWVARTEQGLAHLKALGYENSVRCEVPVDLSEFTFTERTEIGPIVFTNGWGGIHDRKGWPEIQQMLELRPGGVTVFSQKTLGAGEEGAVADPADIYRFADLIIMPSRFEGVGLTLLEAWASGCLVLTTNAPPMNEFVREAFGEYAPLFLLDVARISRVVVATQRWTAHHIDPQAAWGAVDTLRAMSPANIAKFSRMGREYVERVHGRKAVEDLWRAIIG
jgi:hypothetical protein